MANRNIDFRVQNVPIKLVVWKKIKNGAFNFKLVGIHRLPQPEQGRVRFLRVQLP
jgi:hypothetical protein